LAFATAADDIACTSAAFGDTPDVARAQSKLAMFCGVNSLAFATDADDIACTSAAFGDTPDVARAHSKLAIS
jgi:hypothetical protein